MEFLVTEAEVGLRLDVALARWAPHVSRMRLRRALEAGEVRVNGAVQPPGWKLGLEDRVRVEADLAGPTAMTPEPIPLALLHEDPDLVVVDKPSGMVVHPAGRHRGGTLANALAHHFNVAGRAEPPVRPGIVHRLDRETSGLMVVAKTQAALRRLTIDFQEKRVEKRYLALVHGALGAENGTWEAPIGCDPEAFPRWGIRLDGRPGETRWWVRERLADHSVLELEPVTGRTNQLRLHGAHFGHPLVGDALFGRGPEDGPGRLFLHAHRLAFRHPATGETCRFESPLPEPLARLLEQLRLSLRADR